MKIIVIAIQEENDPEKNNLEQYGYGSSEVANRARVLFHVATTGEVSVVKRASRGKETAEQIKTWMAAYLSNNEVTHV